MKRLIPLLFAVLLTGCAGSGQIAYISPSILGGGSPYSDRSDAVGTLLDQAWNAMAEDELSRAGSALSRAMRISPTDPSVYYLMAQLRKEQGQYDQARELAGRALSLGPNHGLKRQLNAFLANLG
ncbi:tetratricopeptide repeat protein [Endozoicomonas numazuensis]|uniref:tetratricopeptide repeat protein n=1 Tax=Endozoicomonas numazuensis TaxID=1137799 RepID=UPI0009DD1975|nr:tetratricopeptide repeat protein [Endozoicomonas numazuensis]